MPNKYIDQNYYYNYYYVLFIIFLIYTLINHNLIPGTRQKFPLNQDCRDDLRSYKVNNDRQQIYEPQDNFITSFSEHLQFTQKQIRLYENYRGIAKPITFGNRILMVYMTLFDKNILHRSSGTQATASINKCLQVTANNRYLMPSIRDFAYDSSCTMSSVTCGEYKKNICHGVRYQDVYFFGKKKNDDDKKKRSPGMGKSDSKTVVCAAKTLSGKESRISQARSTQAQYQSCCSAAQTKGSRGSSVATSTGKAVSIKDENPCPAMAGGGKSDMVATVSHIRIGPKEACPVHGKEPCQGPKCIAASSSGQQAPVKVTTATNPRRGVFELVVRRINGAPLARNELMLEWTPPPSRPPPMCSSPCALPPCSLPCRIPKCRPSVCRQSHFKNKPKKGFKKSSSKKSCRPCNPCRPCPPVICNPCLPVSCRPCPPLPCEPCPPLPCRFFPPLPCRSCRRCGSPSGPCKPVCSSSRGPCSLLCGRPCSPPCSTRCRRPCSPICRRPCSSPICRRPCPPPCRRPCSPPCRRPCSPPCRRPCSPPCRRPCSPPCRRPCSPPCNRPCSPIVCRRPCSPSPPCGRPACSPPCRRPCSPPPCTSPSPPCSPPPCSKSCCTRPCPVGRPKKMRRSRSHPPVKPHKKPKSPCYNRSKTCPIVRCRSMPGACCPTRC